METNSDMQKKSIEVCDGKPILLFALIISENKMFLIYFHMPINSPANFYCSFYCSANISATFQFAFFSSSPLIFLFWSAGVFLHQRVSRSETGSRCERRSRGTSMSTSMIPSHGHWADEAKCQLPRVPRWSARFEQSNFTAKLLLNSQHVRGHRAAIIFALAIPSSRQTLLTQLRCTDGVSITVTGWVENDVISHRNTLVFHNYVIIHFARDDEGTDIVDGKDTK